MAHAPPLPPISRDKTAMRVCWINRTGQGTLQWLVIFDRIELRQQSDGWAEPGHRLAECRGPLRGAVDRPESTSGRDPVLGRWFVEAVPERAINVGTFPLRRQKRVTRAAGETIDTAGRRRNRDEPCHPVSLPADRKGASGRERLLEAAIAEGFGGGDIAELGIKADEPGFHGLHSVVGKQQLSDLIRRAQPLLHPDIADFGHLATGPAADRLGVAHSGDKRGQAARKHILQRPGDFAHRCRGRLPVRLLHSAVGCDVHQCAPVAHECLSCVYPMSTYSLCTALVGMSSTTYMAERLGFVAIRWCATGRFMTRDRY